MMVIQEEELKLTKQHWLNARNDNVNIIHQNIYSTEMALMAIALCDKKIKEFPVEKKEIIPPKVPKCSQTKNPPGVY